METPLLRIRLTDTRRPSQEDVAAKVGLTQSAYSKIERGLVETSWETAEKLTEFFGGRISVDEIKRPEKFPALHPEQAGQAA